MRLPGGNDRVRVFLFTYTLVVLALYTLATTTFPTLGRVIASW
jgi:hypothetical protein